MTTNAELKTREAFEKWMKGREGYPFAGQFADLMWKAWQGAIENTRAVEDAEAVALSDDDVERLSLQAGWEGNRKYMTKADFHIWCDRMRAFVALTHPLRAMSAEDVTESMVIAACVAHDDMYDHCGGDTRADMKARMRKALNAAMAQRGEVEP